jgi:carboxyl-terminal processing protease
MSPQPLLRIHRRTLHGSSALFMAVMLAVAPDLRAQSAASDDPSTAFAIFDECVAKITARAYKPETSPVIYAKPQHGLISALGPSAAAHDVDLSQLTDTQAREQFGKSITTLAALPGQRYSLRELVERSVQAWCRQHDNYTRYLRSDENQLIRLLAKNDASGVGMSATQTGKAIICYPFPGSAAAAAGIKSGDKLLSVDGNPVDDKPIEYATALVRGAPGTEVALRVEHIFGRSETLRIRREPLNPSSIVVTSSRTALSVNIKRFTKSTPGEIRQAMAELPKGGVLKFDLRSCEGGELEPAIEIASMFMEPGETVVSLRERGKPDEVRTTTKPREFKLPTVIFVQDEGTASAAEVLIAALFGSPSNRAASQGTKSFGKGVFQDQLLLKGGGTLILTTGELFASNGRGWEGTGLLPSLEHGGRIFPKE